VLVTFSNSNIILVTNIVKLNGQNIRTQIVKHFHDILFCNANVLVRE